MSALKVDIRRKTYDPIGSRQQMPVIENLSFEAAEAEFVCILGPSGCGKSTLLNLIAGLDTSYEGAIGFAPGVKDHLAYVFQTPRLLPWRTVAQNLALVLPDAAARKAHAAEILAEVGLADFADAFPGQLSLGMQRRAALARAYVTLPKLMLMDEPFVSLDEETAERLRDLLVALWRARPTTILFVTHDSREAIRLGDRLILLSASPCHVLREIVVDLSREQRRDPASIEGFRNANLPAMGGLL